MELKNWRSHLFVKDGSYPTYLPEIIRLPNGDTRTAGNCSLEDINKAGFIGPVNQPPLVPVDKTLIWDSANLSWTLESSVKTVDENFTHTEVVQFIRSELSLCGCHKNGEELSPASKRRVWEYQGKLRELLEKVETDDLKLTWDDVPSKADLNLLTLSEAKSKVNAHLSSSAVREFCELYGLILVSSGIEVELISDIPSSWAPGSSPLPGNIFNENYCIPSGYVFSHLAFEDHGYYYIEKKEIYEQKVSAKLQERLQARDSGSTEV